MKISDNELDKLLKSEENHAFDKTFTFRGLPHKDRAPSRRFAVVAAVALIAVVMTVLFAVVMMNKNNTVPEPPDTDTAEQTGVKPADTAEAPHTSSGTETGPEVKEIVRYDEDFGISFLKNDGSGDEEIVSGKASGSAEAATPAFLFHSEGIVVKVKQRSVHEDTFYGLAVRQKYRLISFDVLDVVRGKNVPETILYLMPEYYYADMSGYDFLYMALVQTGCEGFLLKDAATGELCEFQSPVFVTSEECPALGDVIAFSGGKFDESLWQNDRWLFGSQFGRYYLDNEPDRLVVKRGCTEQYALERIIAQLDGYDYVPDEPTVFYAKNASDAIRPALEYVKSGTFASVIRGSTICYQRYIYGCPSIESLYINFSDNTVTYSKEGSFDNAEIAGLYNIGLVVERMSAEYKESKPKPPHFDPGNLELLSLKVSGYYNKTANGVIPVVTESWIYYDRNDRALYYDERFTVYENGEGREVSLEELSELYGYEIQPEYPHYGMYGVGIYLPYI